MKTFILCTNVLPRDPDAVFYFHDNKVIIPMTVIEEFDHFKRFNDEKGVITRLISKSVDLSSEIL